MTKRISNETDILSQYSKTILMLILARVNGYYNPYIPQTIMEEEAKIMHGEVFSPAEREFFKHRLQTLYPKIGDSDVKTAITLLAEQKAANCPCMVHTDQRDYGWIVFNLFDTFGSAALPIGTHLNYHWERCAPINTTLTSKHLVIQNGFVSQHMK